LTHSKQYLAERFQAADDEIEEHPRYNIAPTQPVLIVRKERGKKIRHFTTVRWGLIPSWAKDMSIGKSNAQRAVGDRDNHTGISRFDPYQTLPHSCGWILRVGAT
jgi:putative SOS response-associated peptidase YedK